MWNHAATSPTAVTGARPPPRRDQRAAGRRAAPTSATHLPCLPAEDNDGARPGPGSEPMPRRGLLRGRAVRMQADAGQGFELEHELETRSGAAALGVGS